MVDSTHLVYYAALFGAGGKGAENGRCTDSPYGTTRVRVRVRVRWQALRPEHVDQQIRGEVLDTSTWPKYALMLRSETASSST
jgi:hypothetical protein